MKNMKKDLNFDSLFKELEKTQKDIFQKDPVDKTKKELTEQIECLDKILKIAKSKNKDTTE